MTPSLLFRQFQHDPLQTADALFEFFDAATEDRYFRGGGIGVVLGGGRRRLAAEVGSGAFRWWRAASETDHRSRGSACPQVEYFDLAARGESRGDRSEILG